MGKIQKMLKMTFAQRVVKAEKQLKNRFTKHVKL